MATQTTGGGSTTSFTKTPQAVDDSYTWTEEQLLASSMYNASTYTVTLDVMANDLGGKAKTLFSVEDGDGNPITADYDLLNKDVNSAGVSPWEKTVEGNWVRINNGKIEFRISDGSGVPGAGVDINSLSEGESFTDEFVYAIRLGNGTLSEARVVVNITGTNDAATIAAQPGGDYAVVEAGGVTNGVPGDPNASGTLIISDVDDGENHFQVPTPASLNGTYGTFTFNNITGLWTYTLDNSHAATQALIAGQAVTETLTVTSFDGTASQIVTVTITGTNDVPVIGGVSTGAVTEDASTPDLTTAGLLTIADDDQGQSNFTVQAATAGSNNYGTFTLAADGSWTYTADNSQTAIQQLGAGETITDSFTAVSSDGTASQIVTVTITGTNDVPVITSDGAGPTAAISVQENTLAVTTVSASDTDAGTVLNYSISGGADAAKFAINSSSGALSFLSVPDFEAPTDAGGNNVYEVVVRASDSSLFDDQAISVTVTNVVEATVANVKFVPNASPSDFEGALPNSELIGTFVAYDAAGNAISGMTFAALTQGTVSLAANGELSGSLSTGTTLNFSVQTTTGYSESVKVQVGSTSGETIVGTADLDIIFGYNGPDTLNGSGNDDTIFGGQNNSTPDTINGGDGDDFLLGGSQNDSINGGNGNDYLRGGSGNDVFIFNAPLSAATNVDTIADFDANSADRIHLENAIFTSLTSTGTLNAANFVSNAGGTAVDGNDYILFDSSTNKLFYDADGNGGGAKILFAQLSLAGGTLDASDFLII